MKSFNVGQVKLAVNRRDGFVVAYALIGKRLIDLTVPLRFVAISFERVRRLFPYFYGIGLRDCDSCGRIHEWYFDWCGNYWRQGALHRRWYGAGDGEVFREIGLITFLRNRA